MKRLVLASALVLGLPANAQAVSCTARDALVANLTRLGEAQSGYGLSRGGQILEIWTSAEKGTWTIVLSRTDGIACIMSYGDAWSMAELVAGAPA